MKKKNQAANATGQGIQRKRKTETYPAATPQTLTQGHVPEEGTGRTNETIDQKGGNTVKRLYRVTSKIHEIFSDGNIYDEVPVSWECVKRDWPIVHPERGVKNYYKQGFYRFYAMDELNQLFSEKEAKALQEYLAGFKDFTMTTLEKVDLPLPLDGLEICAKQDSDEDYRSRIILMLDRWDYDALPFNAAGYYHPRDGVKRQPGLCRTCEKKIDAEVKSAVCLRRRLPKAQP